MCKQAQAALWTGCIAAATAGRDVIRVRVRCTADDAPSGVGTWDKRKRGERGAVVVLLIFSVKEW